MHFLEEYIQISPGNRSIICQMIAGKLAIADNITERLLLFMMFLSIIWCSPRYCCTETSKLAIKKKYKEI